MLTLLVALALADAPAPSIAGLPIHYDVRLQHAIAGYLARPGIGPAYFEFAPASGVGMTEVGPVANWLGATDNWSIWTVQGLNGGTAPTVVAADVEVGPEGYGADRVTFPATTGAQGSRIYATAAGVLNGHVWPLNASVWVKGYGGTSGVIDIWRGDGTPTGCGCAYNGSTWTLCQDYGTNNVAWGGAYIGNQPGSCGSGTRQALDVLLSSAALTVSASRLPVYCSNSAANARCVPGGTPTGSGIPTGRLGEVLTFSRASLAWVTKGINGLRTTNIADGDLVLVPAGVPRVMYDADGVKGLLVESARTNSLLRSQELDNAAVWVPTNSGAAGPTTTNGATAPDNSSTAEVVSVPAVSAGQHSYLGQSFTASAAPWTASVYLRGATAGSTVYLFFRNGATYHTTPCNYVNTSWMRCVVENKTLTAATWEVGLGVDLRDGAQSAQSAQDVRAWGAMGELVSATGPMPINSSSYIATSSAAASRAAESATFAVTSSAGSGCIAMSWLLPRVPASGSVGVAIKSGGSLWSSLEGHGPIGGATNTFKLYASSTEEAFGPSSAATFGQHRIAGWWTATDSLVTVDGASGAHGDGAVHIVGSTISLTQTAAGGIISRVQYDPNPSRCR